MTKGNIRVLQVVDKFGMRGAPIHGGARLLLSWWPAFRETELELVLCVLRGRVFGSKLFDDAGVTAHYLDRGRFDPRTLLDLLRIIRRERIDILHCHGYGASTFGRLAGLIGRRPALVHEHMVDHAIPIYQRLVDRLLAPATTRGIAISNAVREFMTGPRAIRRDKVELVYNTIPSDYCRSFTEDEKASVLERHGIPRGVPLVGIVARLDPVKGHDDFLQAAAILASSHPDVRFLIVGEGQLRKRLEARAGELGISSSVLFLGHCDDVLEILSLLSVLVVASHSEGFSLAAMEGMAQQRPVVATAVGGIPEIIDDGTTGLLVPASEPAALARAVARVLDDAELAAGLGRRAFESCRSRFLIERTVAELGKIYHEVVKR